MVKARITVEIEGRGQIPYTDFEFEEEDFASQEVFGEKFILPALKSIVNAFFPYKR